MNTSNLKLGQEIGIYYYNDRRGIKAKIGIVSNITKSGQVKLSNGKRYTAQGKEIGAGYDPGYLCDVEKVKQLLEEAERAKRERAKKREEYFKTPQGRVKLAKARAVQALIKTLNEHGWYADVDGHMDVMESEIETKIERYLEENNPWS
jgi:hypothetical protein